MADWTWGVGPWTGSAPTRELATAYGRRLTGRADAAFDAQFTLDGDGDEIGVIDLLATDLWCRRDGTLLFRGRIGNVQGSLTASGHVVTFSAIDYRGMLARRVVQPPGVTYAAIDQAAIAWDLIANSQALTGGSFGITNGTGSTSGVNRDATWPAGKPIGEAIGETGRLDDRFEWEISPTLAFNRWYPRRGADLGTRLDYPGTITQLTYGFDPSDFGNADVVTGDPTTTAVAATTAGVGSDLRGRWEVAQSYPTVSKQATLDDRAPWLLGQTSQVRYDYRATLAPGRWGGPSLLWVGDVVYPSLRHGWLTEDGSVAHRAVEIQIVLDGNGGEDVQLGLLAVPS